VRLRGGRETNDRRLDRLPQFDERSRAFPIRTLVAGKPLRSYTWSTPLTLNQGNEGACVGFAWSHELAGRPSVHRWVSNEYARGLYHEAQLHDEWSGEGYEGTSVLAGAKVCALRRHFREYRWAFGLNDLLLALGYAGPAVLGINWWTGMFRPDVDGRIRPTGSVEGGHAIEANQIVVPLPRRPTGQVWVWNSWGVSSGWPRAWLTFDDMERLLNESGEACIPTGRLRVAEAA
jgi:hypothetical protein